MTTDDVSGIVNGYLEAALFTATVPDSNGDPLDGEGYEDSDFSAEARALAEADVRAFLAVPGVADIVVRYDDDDIGRDLYLTANGHGAGFWDGDYEDAEGDGAALTDAAHTLPERNVYGETDADGDRVLHFE